MSSLDLPARETASYYCSGSESYSGCQGRSLPCTGYERLLEQSTREGEGTPGVLSAEKGGDRIISNPIGFVRPTARQSPMSTSPPAILNSSLMALHCAIASSPAYCAKEEQPRARSIPLTAPILCNQIGHTALYIASPYQGRSGHRRLKDGLAPASLIPSLQPH